MIRLLSVEDMRASDAAAIAGGVSGRELMRRAGEAIFAEVKWRSPVGIICGTGNNAGDGYVLGALLHRAGISCSLILTEEKFSEDGKYYFDRCAELGIPWRLWTGDEELSSFATIVDCLFGTGFRGAVSGKAWEIIERINASGAYTVSVDINSGLNGDSGMAELCVRSDLTISVGSFQPGHFLSMAGDVMKSKVNCDIGIAPMGNLIELMEEEDLRVLFPERTHFANKGTYGYIGLVGGSLPYSGAIRLAAMANAAMRSGAGVVKIALPGSLAMALVPQILESTLFPLSDRGGEALFREEEMVRLTANLRTVAFGMGIGATPETEKMLRWILRSFSGTLIIDADGLNLLSRMDKKIMPSAAGRLILTPHVKEFSRLTGLSVEEVLGNPVRLAKSYARETGAVVLLKGPATIITDGNRTILTDTGCPGMATAGSGDVLSGILAALAAVVPDPVYAAAAAAWINGKAGEAAQKKTNPVSMTAGDTAAAIPEVISGIIRG